MTLYQGQTVHRSKVIQIRKKTDKMCNQSLFESSQKLKKQHLKDEQRLCTISPIGEDNITPENCIKGGTKIKPNICYL